MEQAKISVSQLFALMMLFDLGTALVVQIGFSSGRGVWLSILLATIGGIPLYFIFDYLYRQFPTVPLSNYAQRILGRYIGWFVSLLYLGFFVLHGSRVLRDNSEFLVTVSYDQTPLFVISALMTIVTIYVLYKGIEVLARMGEIYLLIMIALGGLGLSFVLASNIIDLKNISPLLENGWKPILYAAYPNILMFPFGDMICFTTILHHLNKPTLGKRTGISAIVLSGVILSLTHAIEVSVLGLDIYSRSPFPLFVTATKVNIADFIERIDVIVILTLIIGAFFKYTIYCYSAVIFTADLFRVEVKKIVVPVGIIMLISSMEVASNVAEFAEEGKKINVPLILPIFSVLIPALLITVHLIRKRFNRNYPRIS